GAGDAVVKPAKLLDSAEFLLLGRLKRLLSAAEECSILWEKVENTGNDCQLCCWLSCPHRSMKDLFPALPVPPNCRRCRHPEQQIGAER
ncbi:MAG TPA: hypothetical protein DIT89_07155, partial [Planctomycetaceae bacterium]|nr:hypothetical protein [Planctomycetaceae bacterium]